MVKDYDAHSDVDFDNDGIYGGARSQKDLHKQEYFENVPEAACR